MMRIGPVRGLLLVCGTMGPGGGCGPPDGSSLLPDGVPEGILRAVQPEEVRALSRGAGVTFVGLRSREEPWAVHLLRIELTRCELGLQVLRAPPTEGMPGGRSTVTDILHVEGEGILAGVNGDFFTPEGLPLGSEIASGEIRRVNVRPAFAWRPGREPWMGAPVLEGDSALNLGWRLRRDDPGPETQVVGGFPLLLKGGGARRRSPGRPAAIVCGGAASSDRCGFRRGPECTLDRRSRRTPVRTLGGNDPAGVGPPPGKPGRDGSREPGRGRFFGDDRRRRGCDSALRYGWPTPGSECLGGASGPGPLSAAKVRKGRGQHQTGHASPFQHISQKTHS